MAKFFPSFKDAFEDLHSQCEWVRLCGKPERLQTAIESLPAWTVVYDWTFDIESAITRVVLLTPPTPVATQVTVTT